MKKLSLALTMLLLACNTTVVPTGCKPTPPELDMATAVLVPNSDVLVTWPTTSPTSPATHFSKIDEGVDTVDNADWNRVRGNVTTPFGFSERFGLQNVPLDVDTITKVEFRFVADRDVADPGLDEFVFNVEIHDGTGDNPIDPPTNGVPVDLATQDDTRFHTYGWTTYVDSLSLTKAQGDGLELVCWVAIPPTVNDRITLSAFEVRITYTPVLSSDKHKMDIGLGFGPGFK